MMDVATRKYRPVDPRRGQERKSELGAGRTASGVRVEPQRQVCRSCTMLADGTQVQQLTTQGRIRDARVGKVDHVSIRRRVHVEQTEISVTSGWRSRWRCSRRAARRRSRPPPPPPPPPPAVADAATAAAAAPVIAQFTAEPSSIERGQSSTLRWAVTERHQRSIDPGRRHGAEPTAAARCSRAASTTYTLTATGPGGNATASATVNVYAPPPPPPPPPPADTRSDAYEPRCDRSAGCLLRLRQERHPRGCPRRADPGRRRAQEPSCSDFPSVRIVVEGHCDERGSAEYNLGLGDRRATAAKEFLVQLGVPADRLKTISYGKERPQCTRSRTKPAGRRTAARTSPRASRDPGSRGCGRGGRPAAVCAACRFGRLYALSPVPVDFCSFLLRIGGKPRDRGAAARYCHLQDQDPDAAAAPTRN